MKPNILLITADDLNYDSIGAYGCAADNITPNLDRLTGEGIRFEHAHVTIAVCQPSRSVLMTGRYPHRNGAMGFQPINRDVPTLTEQLHEAGYYNGIIGKEVHLAPKDKFKWDQYIRTLDADNGYGRSPHVYYNYTKQFLEHSRREGKPFFLMANSHDPHRPFVNSDQELEVFGCHTKANVYYKPDEIEVPGFLPDLPAIREELAQYYTSVHRLDETVGEILRALQESGQEDNTLVMFLSDNGMAFPFAKTNCYLNSTKTPWIARWPNQIKPGGIEDKHFVAGIDFMPTILEAAGLEPIEGMDGRSFLPLLLGEDQGDRDHVFTVFNRTSANKDYPIRCYQDRQYGYIYNAWSDQKTVFENESQSGLTFNAMTEAAASNDTIKERVHFFQYRVQEEFYDFRKDPNALVNLIDAPEYEDKIAEMKRNLQQKMESTNDPVAEIFRRNNEKTVIGREFDGSRKLESNLD